MPSGFASHTTQPEQLYNKFLQDRQFDDQDVQALGLELLNKEQTRSLLGHTSEWSIKLPYRDIYGQLTAFNRVRILTPKGKMKYSQAKASGSHIYFPLNPLWSHAIQNVGIPIIITEGEFKTWAITKAIAAEGLPHVCLGLAGVSSWTDKNDLPLHRDLMQISWKRQLGGRSVYIIFDYDGKMDNGEPNEQVALHENRLALTLVGLGAKVHLCRVGQFITTSGQKYAIDDHLLIGRNLQEVLNTSLDPTITSMPRDLNLYTARTQWGIYDGTWIRLRDGKQFNATKIATEIANISWLEQRMNANGNPVQKVIKLKDAYEEWTKRLSLKGMGLYPQYQGQNLTPEGQYNFMKEWKYEPIEGDCKPWLDWCQYFFQDAPEFESYFHDWVSNIIQRPWCRNNTAIQIISNEQGIGKSFTTGWIAKMIGDMAISIGPDQIFRKFNAHLANKIYVTVDEPSSDNEDHADFLKDLITGDTVTMEGKGVDAIVFDNYINYAFTTNRPKVTKMSTESRREAVYIPSTLDAAQCHVLIQQVKAWCEDEQGFEQMMWFYKTRNIESFDHKAPAPMTLHKEEVIKAGRSAWVQFAEEVYDWVERELNGVAAISKQHMKVLIQHFDYESARLSQHNVNNAFREYFNVEQSKLVKTGTSTIRCLVVSKKRTTFSGNYSDVYSDTAKAIAELIKSDGSF